MDFVAEYLKTLRRRGFSPRTLRLRQIILSSYARQLKKSWDAITQEEMMQAIEARGNKPITERKHRNILNLFFKEMGIQIKLPYLKVQTVLPVQPSDLLSPGDVLKIIDAAHHPRDKALVAVCYESGCRMSELLGLRKKDVTFNTTHARIRVQGKTGERIIPLVESVPYLLQWMNACGELADEEGIWQGYHGPIKRTRFQYLLSQLSKKALGRHVNPHLLRHSRATYLVKNPNVSEAVICALMGWRPGSPVMQRYIHLAGTDVEEAILTMHGVTELTKEQGSSLKPKVCLRCQHENPADAKFCAYCSLSLVSTVEMLKEEALFMRILKDKEVEQLIEDKLREIMQKEMQKEKG